MLGLVRLTNPARAMHVGLKHGRHMLGLGRLTNPARRARRTQAWAACARFSSLNCLVR
jgi:hypothetical protein